MEHQQIMDLLDAAGKSNAGKWEEITDDDGFVGFCADNQHFVVIGNLEGSCAFCHAVQHYAVIAANLAPELAREVIRLRAALAVQQTAARDWPMLEVEGDGLGDNA